MRSYRVVLFTVLLAGVVPPGAALAQAPRSLSPDDTAAIVAAAWAQTSAGHRGLRAVLFRFPVPADTSRIVRLSPGVRAGLERRGLPITDRPIAGDDTVVFHVAGWDNDSAGATVEMRSVAVRRMPTGWSVGPRGPVRHGDRICEPISPS
jgi:hypothetical protein